MSGSASPFQHPFQHHCWCGAWAPYGYGVSLIRGIEGHWFCGNHRPELGLSKSVGELLREIDAVIYPEGMPQDAKKAPAPTQEGGAGG